MNIIRKLIIRNQLKRNLRLIEQQLVDSGYYKMDLKLRPWAYNPDRYAIEYDKLHAQFQPLVDQKEELSLKISSLSGKNLFKTNIKEL